MPHPWRTTVCLAYLLVSILLWPAAENSLAAPVQSGPVGELERPRTGKEVEQELALALPRGTTLARAKKYLADHGYRIFAESPDGHRRTAHISLVDLRVEKNFQMARSLNVAFTADIFNLFNSKAFYDVASQLVGAGDFASPSVFVPPRRVMLGVKVKF